MLHCTKFGENVERNNRNHGLCIKQYWTIEVKNNCAEQIQSGKYSLCKVQFRNKDKIKSDSIPGILRYPKQTELNCRVKKK